MTAVTPSWFTRELMTLDDGRSLEVYLSGDPGGIPTVFHNGTPSAGLPFRATSDLAGERGMRLITYSRAGYGASSRNPGRSVADIASDVTAILDRLDADRCYTVGWSGGGPHVLATAALLPERVIAAASIAGVAPYDAEGLDFMDGMGAENHVEFGAAVAGPERLEPYLDRERAWMATVTADQVAAGLGDLVGDVDRAAITGDYAEWLATTFRASVSNGIWGWFDDDMAFVRPWGFDIGSIRRPVAIWQGDQDRMVPFAHGKWLAAHVGNARAHLHPGHGHLSLGVASMGQILDSLLVPGPESS